MEKLRGQSLSPALTLARLLDAPPGFERSERIEVQADGQKFGTLVRSKAGELTITLTPSAAIGAPVDALESAIADAIRRARSLG